MFQLKQTIPYDAYDKEVAKVSKDISKYIALKPLPLDKKISNKFFEVFLKKIPADQRDKYKREGIPFNFKTKDDQEIQYTLVLA